MAASVNMEVLDAQIETSAIFPDDYPQDDLPEFAFLGRSNVGKSSLLNRLVGRRQLARTSGTPGKTRLLHFFRIRAREAVFRLVDLPGYGYAKVGRKERKNWKEWVERYLAERKNLRVAVLLQDVRRDFSEDESLLLDWLDQQGVVTCIAVTKADKLSRNKAAQRLRNLGQQIDFPKERLILTSAQTGQGIADVWEVLHKELLSVASA